MAKAKAKALMADYDYDLGWLGRDGGGNVEATPPRAAYAYDPNRDDEGLLQSLDDDALWDYDQEPIVISGPAARAQIAELFGIEWKEPLLADE